MNVTFFNGGRGAKFIFDPLLKLKNIKINSIVNAYDDGKSTGQIREFFNMLGPSDIRKTQTCFLDKNHTNYIHYFEPLVWRRLGAKRYSKIIAAIIAKIADIIKPNW